MTQQISYQEKPTGAEAPPAEAINDQAGVNKAGEQPQGERPAWLPENYKTVEDFVKSSTDMRAELTRAQQELAKLKKGEEPPKKEGEKKPDEVDADAAKKALEESGVDNAPYQQAFDAEGDLSDEMRDKAAKDYEAFIKKTFGEDANAREIVDRWVDGQKALLGNYRNAVVSEAGGDEAYAEMTAWAKTGYTAAEQAVFNKAVNSGDLNAARQAVSGLMARFTKANGKQPSLVNGDGNSAPAAGFASTFEMQKAIADPRYEKDPAYRKSVEQRVFKSNF